MHAITPQFKRFIRERKVKALARDLDILPGTVYAWLQGTYPSVANAHRLVRMAKGDLTLEDILPPRETTTGKEKS